MWLNPVEYTSNRVLIALLLGWLERRMLDAIRCRVKFGPPVQYVVRRPDDIREDKRLVVLDSFHVRLHQELGFHGEENSEYCSRFVLPI
jgi:hypothetical protein